MGWGFRKSIKIAPGVRINLSKRGVSASIGGKGLTYNTRGRLTASIPGTGIRYTQNLSARKTSTPIHSAVAASGQLDSSGENRLSKREQATRDFVMLIRSRTSKALQDYFISHGVYVLVDDLAQAVTLEDHQDFLERLGPSFEVTTRAIKLAVDIGSISLAEKEKAMLALYSIERICEENHGEHGELKNAAVSLSEQIRAWPAAPAFKAAFLMSLLGPALLLKGLFSIGLTLIIVVAIYGAFRLKAFERSKTAAQQRIEDAESRFDSLLRIEVSPRPAIPRQDDNTRLKALALAGLTLALALAAIAYRSAESGSPLSVGSTAQSSSSSDSPPKTETSAPASSPARADGATERASTNASTDTANALTYRTSFDCSGARSDAEHLICSDPTLAADDVELAEIFAKARAAAPDSAVFKAHTRQQWNYRERNCHDHDCLTQWYADQKQWLLSILNSQRPARIDSTVPSQESPSYPTSFGCTATTRADEKAICGDPSLATMDVEMAHDYVAAMQRGAPDKLESDQRDWIAQRRDCVGDLNCLRHAYGVRIDQLQRWPR